MSDSPTEETVSLLLGKGRILKLSGHPTCGHSWRRIKGHDMCNRCYNAFRRKTMKNTICGHLDKENYIKGMCVNCYKKSRVIGNGDPEYRQPLISLNFTISHNCILCGDGWNKLNRKCLLHPEICNTCHAEYCECETNEKIQLMALEDIAKYPEDEQIGLLKTRKMILRAAGKKTSSIPFLKFEGRNLI